MREGDGGREGGKGTEGGRVGRGEDVTVLEKWWSIFCSISHVFSTHVIDQKLNCFLLFLFLFCG